MSNPKNYYPTRKGVYKCDIANPNGIDYELIVVVTGEYPFLKVNSIFNLTLNQISHQSIDSYEGTQHWSRVNSTTTDALYLSTSDDTNLVVKREFMSLIFEQNLMSLNLTEIELDVILKDVAPLLANDNCEVTPTPVTKFNGVAYAVEDHKHTTSDLLKKIENGHTIILFTAAIMNGEIFHRYVDIKP